MKVSHHIWIGLLMFCCCWAHAQHTISVTPFMGLNSTRMLEVVTENVHDEFTTGTTRGNFLLAGIETEFRITAKSKRFGLSAVTGCSYLANGFYYDYQSGVDISNLFNIYGYEKTELKMKYVQFPLELKLNWQPFPLVENFNLFVGAGVSGSILLEAHLAEEGIYSISSNLGTNPPSTSYYQDEADVTNLGRKQSLFRRLELGGRYKRFQFSWRVSKSLQDMYFKGLEDNWAVPVDRSYYLTSRNLNGKILEKYVEVVVGYRIF